MISPSVAVAPACRAMNGRADRDARRPRRDRHAARRGRGGDGHLVRPGDNLRRDEGTGGVGLTGIDRHARILVDDNDPGVGHESAAGIENLAANGSVRILRVRHWSVRSRDE